MKQSDNKSEMEQLKKLMGWEDQNPFKMIPISGESIRILSKPTIYFHRHFIKKD